MAKTAKSKEAGAKITLKTLHAALSHQYPASVSDLPEMDEQELFSLLTRLQVAELDTSPILDHITSECTDSRPSGHQQAIIAFLDDCLATALATIKLSPVVQPPLFNGIASLMRAALAEGLTKASKDHGVLKVLDQLILLALGWNEKQGKSATSILEQIKTSIASLSMVAESQVSDAKIRESRDAFLDKLSRDIDAFSEKEQKRINRLEDRLVASETGILKTSRARNMAAQMLNEHMNGLLLPPVIIRFLQGAWYDSLQLILAREGVQSDKWFRATKLTETLLWTLGIEGLDTLAHDESMGVEETEEPQSTRADFMSDIEEEAPQFNANERVQFNSTEPDEAIAFPSTDSSLISEAESPASSDEESFLMDDGIATNTAAQPTTNQQLSNDEKQKLYRIVEELPKEIKPLLLSLEYQEESKLPELQAIQSSHASIMTGEPMEKVSSTPLPCEPEVLGMDTAISQTLMTQVNNIQTGQWFAFEQQSEKVEHIKLLLKLDDMQQLLFTNRSGVKVLQTNFEEFAYFISSDVAIPIHPTGPLSSLIRSKLNKIVTAYLAYQKSAKASAEKAAEAKRHHAKQTKKQLAEAAALEAKIAEQTEAEMHSTQIFLKAVQQKALKTGNEDALKSALEKVDGLCVGAWLRIPGHDFKPTECKLGVKLLAIDKYVFVDRRGLKVGEFNREQLASMQITGDCEILDSGTEVEDTLEKVVTGLRKHRSLQDDD
jgi:hypothetical protein